MDWKSLVDKTKNIASKAKPLFDKTKAIADKAAPIVEKAKTYGSWAVAYVGKQIEQTPIFLKTEEEYNIHVASKRSILVAYDSRDESSEAIRVMVAVWKTQAWTDAAELKFLEISGNEDLAKTLKIVGPLEMRVAYMGEEYGRFHTVEEIKSWWKTRNYIQDDNPTSIVVENPKQESVGLADPLSEIEKKPRAPRKKKTPTTPPAAE
jgi:hypothetical protein